MFHPGRFMNNAALSPAAGGGGGYQAYGVAFPNSPYVGRASSITTSQWYTTISFWFNFTGLDSTTQFLIIGAGNHILVQKFTDNQIYVQLHNPASANAFSFVTSVSGGFTTSSNTGWHHLVFSADVNTGVGSAYLDDSTANIASLSVSSGTVVYWSGTSNFGVGARSDGLNKAHAGLAEVWINSSYHDLSNTTERRKFITASLHPENLSLDGSLFGDAVTGSKPLVYFRSDGTPANFATNQGTGGAFTLTGTLNNAASNP